MAESFRIPTIAPGEEKTFSQRADGSQMVVENQTHFYPVFIIVQQLGCDIIVEILIFFSFIFFIDIGRYCMRFVLFFRKNDRSARKFIQFLHISQLNG